jgi:hypothetical protein
MALEFEPPGSTAAVLGLVKDPIKPLSDSDVRRFGTFDPP